MTAPSTLGSLYLVPTPLDFGCGDGAMAPLDHSLPLQTIATASRLTHWVAENAKSARAFLKRVHAVQPLALPLQAQQIVELPRQVHKKGDHSPPADNAQSWLAAALQGHDIGLLSEAGMPAVADPGSSVVRAAHAMGMAVRPLAGPVSLTLALAASGCNGQDFAFVGYLPQEATARAQRLRELETRVQQTGQTQMWIETPYRNAAMLQTLLSTLKPATRLAVCCALTLPQERVFSGPVSHWKTHAPTLPLDAPTVFVIGQ